MIEGRHLQDCLWPKIVPFPDGPDDNPKPGDYWHVGYGPNGSNGWYVCPPFGSGCASIGRHRVVVESDGTISVPEPKPGEEANSILIRGIINGVSREWHGYVYHGVWYEITELGAIPEGVRAA
jgi:hypothetical protein